MGTREFEHLLEELDVPEYASTPQRVDQINRMVREKMAIDRGRRVGRRKGLAVLAAAVAAAGLLAAAGYFTASDAFRGFLKERDAGGGQAELSSTAPIVDRTGSVLHLAQPVESGGIRVTPTAIAGDDSSFTVLFELESVDGSPIGLEQADGSHSAGRMMFRRSWLHMQGVEPDRMSSQAKETKVDGAKATVLQRFDLYEPMQMGQVMHIELDTLRQQADMRGQATGLAGQTLYDAVTRLVATGPETLAPVSEGEFTGASGAFSVAGEAGEVYLAGESETPVALSGALQGYQLTGALLHEGTLYLRGTAGEETATQDRLASSALVAPDGAAIEFDVIRVNTRSGPDGDEWWVTFAGIGSAEQLRELEWLVGHGFSMYERAAGSWAFDIVLEYDIITRDIEIGERMEIAGCAGVLERLTISPYKLTFDFVPDDKSEDTIEAVRESWDIPLSLDMRVGRAITPLLQDTLPVYATRGDETSPLTAIRFYYEIEDVIDPKHAAELLYNGARYLLPS